MLNSVEHEKGLITLGPVIPCPRLECHLHPVFPDLSLNELNSRQIHLHTPV